MVSRSRQCPPVRRVCRRPSGTFIFSVSKIMPHVSDDLILVMRIYKWAFSCSTSSCSVALIILSFLKKSFLAVGTFSPLSCNRLHSSRWLLRINFPCCLHQCICLNYGIVLFSPTAYASLESKCRRWWSFWLPLRCFWFKTHSQPSSS